MVDTPMRTLLHTEFAALLARAGTSQAGFARLTGLSPRQVNNWCRGRAAVPAWAAALAVLLEERSPEAITLLVEEAAFAWHETLGVPPGAGADEIHRALCRLVRCYAPDLGGTEAQMTRINAAYAQTRTTPEHRSRAED
jgi:transcriptional regulator with XRE-family HTH domain